MINIGTKEITSIYCGKNAVNGIYCGQKLIWPTTIPPTPGGDYFGMEITSEEIPDITRDITYDPTSKEDALKFDGASCYKRYEINGKVFYLNLGVRCSGSAVIEGEYAKVDQVIVWMNPNDAEYAPGSKVEFSGYLFDGNKISSVLLYKQFDSVAERWTYLNEWMDEINNGEPVIKLDLPDDIDDWQLYVQEEFPEEFIIENNDEYFWYEMEFDGEMYKGKFFKQVPTYPQWKVQEL